eukprot:Tbor_TRINITY_DN4730_c0_g1::TRINITY_DN4730_c0_g1_i1::g.16962::m.16962/K19750/DNAAF1, LRRC50, ODA7; dynein assembly factor 1, axonemal
MTEETNKMTPEALRMSCKKNNGYNQPHLNDQLFLQCRGFTLIENLAPYTDLKVLWLEQNSIGEVSGLEHQRELVSLFLHNNVIRSMDGGGFNNLSNLRILNLSHNFITRICGIAISCPLLESFLMSHNQLQSLSDCEELLKMEYLSTVDISFNKIELTPQQEKMRDIEKKRTDRLLAQRDGNNNNNTTGSNGDDVNNDNDWELIENNDNIDKQEEESETTVPSISDLSVVSFFKNMPVLGVLYLQGNGLVHTLKNYRKNMVANLQLLTYLDERPVFPEERRATEAWARGGPDAESMERKLIRDEKTAYLKSCVTDLVKMSEAGKEQRILRTKVWEEQKEVERREAESRQKKFNKAAATLICDEDDSRLVINCEESGVWVDIEEAMESTLRTVINEENKRQKELLMQEQTMAAIGAMSKTVEKPKEIKSVDDFIEHIAKGANTEGLSTISNNSPLDVDGNMTITIDDQSDEMSHWLLQMELTDDEAVQQMEDDMKAMLLSITPPVVPDTVIASDDTLQERRRVYDNGADVTSNFLKNNNYSYYPADSHQPRSQRLSEVVTQAEPNIVSIAVSSSTTVSEIKVKGKAAKHTSAERIWEEYEAWENLAMRRFQKKK